MGSSEAGSWKCSGLKDRHEKERQSLGKYDENIHTSWPTQLVMWRVPHHLSCSLVAVLLA